MRRYTISALLVLLSFPMVAQYREQAVNQRDLERMEKQVRQDSISRAQMDSIVQVQAMNKFRQDSIVRAQAMEKYRQNRIALQQVIEKARQDSIRFAQEDSIAAVQIAEKQYKDSVRREKTSHLPVAWQRGCKLRMDMSGGMSIYNGNYSEITFNFSADLVFAYACNPWIQIGVGARCVSIPTGNSLTPIVDMRLYVSPYKNKKVRAYFDLSGGYTAWNYGQDIYLQEDLSDAEVSKLIASAYFDKSELREINGSNYQYRAYYLMNGNVQQKVNGAVSFGMETLHGFVLGMTYSLNYMTARVIGVTEYDMFGTVIRGPIQNNIATHNMLYHNIALNIGWNIPLAKERRELK